MATCLYFCSSLSFPFVSTVSAKSNWDVGISLVMTPDQSDDEGDGAQTASWDWWKLDSRFLSLQQAPVGCDLHFQVLLDAEQLFVVGLCALHVQPELGQVVLQLAQGHLQPLHLAWVFLTRLAQVTLQRCYLRRENKKRVSVHLCLMFPLCVFNLAKCLFWLSKLRNWPVACTIKKF